MSTITAAMPAEPSASGVINLLRDHPNLVRALSLGAFVVIWELVGRRMDPIFMTYPTAVARASVERGRWARRGFVDAGPLICRTVVAARAAAKT